MEPPLQGTVYSKMQVWNNLSKIRLCIKTVVRCTNSNPRTDEVRSSGHLVITSLGHIIDRMTQKPSFKCVAVDASSAGTPRSPLPRHSSRPTALLSGGISQRERRHFNAMSYCLVSLGCHTARLQARLRTSAVPPASGKLHVYLSTRSFLILFLQQTRGRLICSHCPSESGL